MGWQITPKRGMVLLNIVSYKKSRNVQQSVVDSLHGVAVSPPSEY